MLGTPLTSRIIPALAGNTLGSPEYRSKNRDHPRSRGEYALVGGAIPSVVGSSPLSRGIRRALDIICAPEGIIPALAGNTYRRVRRR